MSWGTNPGTSTLCRFSCRMRRRSCVKCRILTRTSLMLSGISDSMSICIPSIVVSGLSRPARSRKPRHGSGTIHGPDGRRTGTPGVVTANRRQSKRDMLEGRNYTNSRWKTKPYASSLILSVFRESHRGELSVHPVGIPPETPTTARSCRCLPACFPAMSWAGGPYACPVQGLPDPAPQPAGRAAISSSLRRWRICVRLLVFRSSTIRDNCSNTVSS